MRRTNRRPAPLKDTSRQKRRRPTRANMHHADRPLALNTTSERAYGQATKAKQRSPTSGAEPRTHRFTRGQNKRAAIKLCALWAAAVTIFAFGLSSVLRSHSVVSGPAPSLQQSNSSAPVTPTSPHAMFRVDGTTITDTQWHNAVQAAFSARASSGQYLGGTQADTMAINAQALHIVLDPLAEQELAKDLGLTTNTDALYQQWFSQSSLQDQQTAQKSQSDGNYKQQMAQEQLKKNIINKLTTLPPPGTADVYAYYQQHLAQFARTAPQMHLQQIIVTSPQAAQHVVDQINQGVPFSTVEANYDVSGPFYRAHGGDLGWITVGGSGYPPEWNANVLSLKAGQVGNPFQVNGSYYIVKCVEGPDYEPWPFSQVQNQASQSLVLDQISDAFARIISQKEKAMHIALLDSHYGVLLQQLTAILRNS